MLALPSLGRSGLVRGPGGTEHANWDWQYFSRLVIVYYVDLPTSRFPHSGESRAKILAEEDAQEISSGGTRSTFHLNNGSRGELRKEFTIYITSISTGLEGPE